MSEQIWEVIGGATSGGLVVRAEESTTSEELLERLSHGALVRELAIEGNRLKFVRISGTGPPTGWVSTSFRSTNLLVKCKKAPDIEGALLNGDDEKVAPDQRCGLYCVSGGSGKGGILVRQQADTSSEAMVERLSTGSIVRVTEIIGERAHYELVEGVGPCAGWVSIVLKGASLLFPLYVRTLEVPEIESHSLAEFAPIVDRKPRILAIHGAPANSDFMSFQTAQLRFKLGKDIADWIIPTGLFPWEPLAVKTTPDFETYTRERTEFEKRLAKGKPFTVWFPLSPIDGSFHIDREKFIQSRNHVKQLIETESPIDVVVTFSQAAILLCSVMDAFRQEGKPIPWRLNLLFGAPSTDPLYPVHAPFSTTTVFAWGEQDPWVQHRHMWHKVFIDETILEYGDGHEFPTKEPQASQLYGEMVQEIRRLCGIAGT